jgi:hypothetical protein
VDGDDRLRVGQDGLAHVVRGDDPGGPAEIEEDVDGMGRSARMA